MKKNILTIIIMAITLINTVLLALIIFAIVPTSNRTNQLVTKVASIVDLELEDTQDSEVAVSDIITQKLEDKLTITLNSSSADPHYAVLFLSLSMNSKNEDYELLSGKITENEGPISEIVTEEFGKYTIDNVQEHKEDIRQAVLTRVQELFQSDFIINVSFGNVVYN